MTLRAARRGLLAFVAVGGWLAVSQAALAAPTSTATSTPGATPSAGPKATKTKPGAKAKGGKAAAGRGMSADTLEKLRADLNADSDMPALAAAKQLGASGAPNASGPLIEVLAVGARPSVASAAIEALGSLKDSKAFDVLEIYAGNRNAEVRSRALRALGAIPDARAADVLLARLGDTAPDVRAVAAETLAERKEAKAEPRLYELVKRNDSGAAAPLGILATPDTIARLAELQGRVDDNVLATTLGEYLKRDVLDKLRLEVVVALGKIPGAGATTALVEYLATVPEKEDRPSEAEAQKIIDQRSTAK